MRNYKAGIAAGFVAGLFSAASFIFTSRIEMPVFLMEISTWVITGLMITAVDSDLHCMVKGGLLAVIVSIPVMICLGYYTDTTIILNIADTIVLGALVGFFVERMQISQEKA